MIISPFTLSKAIKSEWSPSITANTEYHWKASKSELRDLKTEERYATDSRESWTLIGGINLPNGGIRLELRSPPSTGFNFFNGSRLNFRCTIEGDTGPHLTVNGSDFHLLILPLTMNNISFFDHLFKEITLLENLTHASYLNSSISISHATVWLKYNEIHDVKYEWDITTGLLSRKEVIAPSGLRLVIIPGKGLGFICDFPFCISEWSLGVFLLIIASLCCWFLIKYK
jgi:hypothetical protein